MWKEIDLHEFAELRKESTIPTASGVMLGGGDFAEWGQLGNVSRIRWESDLTGSRWYLFVPD